MTLYDVGLRLLRYIGVTSYTAQTADSELDSVTAGDLDDVVMCVTAALQVIHKKAPGLVVEQPGGAYLNAPTTVTLTVGVGSKVISVFTTWAAWMAGCTIRIAGDDQDNILLSATALARPFAGSAGSHTATVYGDCITLEEGLGRVIAPVFLSNQIPLWPAADRAEFMLSGGISGLTDTMGRSAPLYWFVRKTIGRPVTYIGETYFDGNSVLKRLRFAPLPNLAYALGFAVTLLAERYTSSDVVKSDGTDPGTTLPLFDDDIESVLIPIALQRFSGTALFKNETARPEIARQYREAMTILESDRVLTASTEIEFI